MAYYDDHIIILYCNAILQSLLQLFADEVVVVVN